MTHVLGSHGFTWSTSMQMSHNLHFTTSLDLWTLFVTFDLINIQLFKWGEFYILSPSYNLISDDFWPWYMTVDRMIRIQYFINNQVWFGFQLFKWGHSHFQPILQLDIRWLLTLICDLWSHQKMRVHMLNPWPNFGWNPSKHVEGRAKY